MNLVWNEQIKLYAKKSTWVMIALLAVISLAGGLVNKFMDTNVKMTEYSEDWKTELQEENRALSTEMEEDEFAKVSNPKQIEKNNYYLESDIKPQPYDGWQYVLDHAFFTSIISLFTIIVAAGIVSNEFKWGTIKLLLIRPISRTIILLSKYVSVLLFALTLLVSLLLFSWGVGALLFGLNGISPTIVQEQPNGFFPKNVTTEILLEYGLSMITLIMMATFAFAISAIFRSSGMAIGLAIFLMMTGNSIVIFISQYEWAKYILFANTNLRQYLNGSQPIIEGMTMTFSIIILFIYLAIFLGASWSAFTKRDIAGS